MPDNPDGGGLNSMLALAENAEAGASPPERGRTAVVSETTGEQHGQQSEEASHAETSGASDPDVIRLRCSCGRRLRIRRSQARRQIKCPQCRRVVKVPEQKQPSSDPARVPTKPAGDDSRKYTRLAGEIEGADPSEATASRGKGTPRKRKTLWFWKLRRLSHTLQSETGANKKEDVRLRCEAVEELGRSGDGRALELLLSQLDHASAQVRAAAAAALGELGDAEALGPLIRLLDDESYAVHQAAVTALGQLGDGRAVLPLLHVAVDYPHLRYPVTETVQALGEPAVPRLVETLRHDDPHLRLEAVVQCGRAGSDRATRPLLALLKQKLSAEARARVAEALGRIGDKQAVPGLVKLLKDDETAVRHAAATALGRVPAPAAVKPLLWVVKHDSDVEVRNEALAAAAGTEDRRVAASLVTLLKHENTELRFTAAEALARLGAPAAIETLLARLHEACDAAKASNTAAREQPRDEEQEDEAEGSAPALSDPDSVLVRSINALKRFRDPRVVKEFQSLLRHDDDRVRVRVVEALGQVGEAETAERLESVLKGDRSEEVRAAAAKALGDIGDPASVECLQQALHDVFPVCCRAVVALGRIGDEAARPSLEALLKDPVPEVRFHAAGALADLELDLEEARPLIEPLLEDSISMVRRGAAKALIRLGDPRGEALADEGGQRKWKRPLRDSVPSLSGFSFSFSDLTEHITWPETWTGRSIAVGAPLLVLLLAASPWIIGMGNAPVVVRGRVASLAFGPEGRQLAVGRTFGLLEVWDAAAESIVRRLSGPTGRIAGVAFAPDGKTVLMVVGRDLLIWNGAQTTALSGHDKGIASVTVTPDGRLAATYGRDKLVVWWNLQTFEHVNAVQLPQETVVFAPGPKGDKVVSGNGAGMVTLWDGETAEMLGDYDELQGETVRALAVSPDGKRVAAAGLETVVVWSLKTGEVQATRKTEQPVALLRFLPDSQRLVTVAGIRVQLWNPDNDETRSFATPDSELLEALAVTPDGSRLAVGSPESSPVWVYDVETGEVVSRLNVAS